MNLKKATIYSTAALLLAMALAPALAQDIAPAQVPLARKEAVKSRRAQEKEARREMRSARKEAKAIESGKELKARVKKERAGKKGPSISSRRRLKEIQKDTTNVGLSLSKEDITAQEYGEIYSTDMSKFRDTIRVTDINGNEAILMRAIKDEDSGEMVANEVLDAAVVTARFRNIAERHGKINLQFDVTVPHSMLDNRWKVRLFPQMEMFGQRDSLDPIYVTGWQYLQQQMRGYERYNQWLKNIITDPMLLIDVEQLEWWLQRHIPKLYELKYEDDYVSDAEFASIYGVTERQAVAHYTNRILVGRNERFRAKSTSKFHKFVKAPYDTVGLRLDSLIVNADGDFVYTYTETIAAKKDLRKVDVYLAGDILEQEKKIYNIPEGKPLTFYIASLATFVDKTPRYMLKVIDRHAEANAEYNIEFEEARADIKPELANNAAQISNIKKDISRILANDTYILDSIVVTSYASPEGGEELNHRLCGKRSEAVSRYFDSYVRQCKDSLLQERGVHMTLDGQVIEEEKVDVKFKNVMGGENWYVLNQLVEMDNTLTAEDKTDYFDQTDIKDLDARERTLSRKPYYAYMRENLYPKTRIVRFNFLLHRKGMTKDTIQTHVLDSVYMRGVQALEDRDFETAVQILRPYRDYNSAIAFTAMDYNISALSVLEKLPKTAQVEYMMAIIKSRQGDDQEAVQHYLNSVRMEPSYKYRGNLDPEISILIQRYGLNKDDEEDFENF